MNLNLNGFEVCIIFDGAVSGLSNFFSSIIVRYGSFFSLALLHSPLLFL